MNLASLECGAEIFGNIAVLCRDKVGESMTCLMSEYIYIACGAVEIREDKRRMVIGKLRAVAAGCLALLCEHIEKLVFKHEIYKFRRFGRERVIHFLACGEDLLGCALGFCVSVGEAEAVIIEIKLIDTDSCALAFLRGANERNYLRRYLLTKTCNFFCSVAVSAEAVIAELHKTPVAELFGDFTSYLHKLVVYFVKFLAVRIKAGTLGIISFLSRLSVGTFFIGTKLCHWERFAVYFNGAGSIYFLIFGDELIFLLYQTDDSGRECPAGNLDFSEDKRAELFLQLGTESALEQSRIESLNFS